MRSEQVFFARKETGEYLRVDRDSGGYFYFSESFIGVRFWSTYDETIKYLNIFDKQLSGVEIWKIDLKANKIIYIGKYLGKTLCIHCAKELVQDGANWVCLNCGQSLVSES